MDDHKTSHQMSTGHSEPNHYTDKATKEKIRRLEQLEIRPAITVYRENDS